MNGPGQAFSRRNKRHIVLCLHIEDQTLFHTVIRQQPDPLGDRILRGCGSKRGVRRSNGAAFRGIRAEQGPRERRPARADQTGDPQNLTGAQRKGNILQNTGSMQFLHAKDFRAGRSGNLGKFSRADIGLRSTK